MYIPKPDLKFIRKQQSKPDRSKPGEIIDGCTLNFVYVLGDFERLKIGLGAVHATFRKNGDVVTVELNCKFFNAYKRFPGDCFRSMYY